HHENATDAHQPAPSPPALLARTRPAGWDLVHQEEPFDDYELQFQLPEKLSYGGPCIAVADVNGDGHDDVHFGGATGHPGVLLLGAADGSGRSVSKAA